MIKNPAFQFCPCLFSALRNFPLTFSSTMTSCQRFLCALYIFSTPPLTPAPVWIIITKGRWDISAAFVLPSFLLPPSPGGRGDATAWYRRILWRRRCPDKILMSVYRGGLHCEGRYAALTEKGADWKRARGEKNEMYGRPQQTQPLPPRPWMPACIQHAAERGLGNFVCQTLGLFFVFFFFVRKIAMACF